MKKLRVFFAAFALTLSLLLTFVGCELTSADKQFNVQFLVDGEVYATVATVGNETVAFPDEPTKEDCVFGGWYFDEGLWEEPFTKDSLAHYTLTWDVYVYAKWLESSTDGLMFKYLPKSNSYSVTGYDGTDSVVLIADTHDGRPVTQIAKNAFANCTQLHSITIPSSIKTIDSSAFENCYHLVEVINRSSIAIEAGSNEHGYVGYYAIEVHSGESKLATQGDYQFYTYQNKHFLFGYTGTSNQLQLPEDYNGERYTLYDYAFEGCTELSSVVIPDGAEAVGDYAFEGCTALAEITLPDSVKRVGAGAFENDEWLTTVSLGNGVEVLGDYAFKNCTALAEITLPDSVTELGVGTFENNSELASVSFGSNVESLGDYAFKDCSTLTEITVPNSVTEIGLGAFENCSALKKISVPFVGHVKDDNEDVHFGYIFGANYSSGNESYVPAELATVVVTDSETIGVSAFFECKNVKNVTLSNCVKTIKLMAFKDCTALTKLTLGNGIKTIEDYAFDGCDALYSVFIDDLKAWCAINVGSYDSSPMQYANTLYLDDEELIDLVLPDGVSHIPDYAFSSISINSVMLPESIRSIGKRAFMGCETMQAIDVPNSVESIGEEAFKGCVTLQKVNVGSAVKTMGANVFEGCKNITAMTLPFVGATNDETNNVPLGYLFGNPDGKWHKDYLPLGLSQLVITGGSILSDRALYDCAALTSVTIPTSVTKIGYEAFSGCVKLTNIETGESVEHISDYAFKNCTSITQATIKGGFLGQYAFLGCTELKKVFLGIGVTKVGYSVFPQNDGLTIYCEALSQPDEWDGNWNRYEATVYWNSSQLQ